MDTSGWVNKTLGRRGAGEVGGREGVGVIYLNIYNSPGSLILGDPGAVNRVDKMFEVKVYCKIEGQFRAHS